MKDYYFSKEQYDESMNAYFDSIKNGAEYSEYIESVLHPLTTAYTQMLKPYILLTEEDNKKEELALTYIDHWSENFINDVERTVTFNISYYVRAICYEAISNIHSDILASNNAEKPLDHKDIQTILDLLSTYIPDWSYRYSKIISTYAFSYCQYMKNKPYGFDGVEHFTASTISKNIAVDFADNIYDAISTCFCKFLPKYNFTAIELAEYFNIFKPYISAFEDSIFTLFFYALGDVQKMYILPRK